MFFTNAFSGSYGHVCGASGQCGVVQTLDNVTYQIIQQIILEDVSAPLSSMVV